MGRIRHIHPRASQDEDVASMSIAARHLWDRLPCYADREGRLEDRPLMLKGEVFPADQVNVSDLLKEFEDRGFIVRYLASNGRRQIQIVSFHDYQRPDHREKDSVLEPPPGWTEDKRGTWANVGQIPGKKPDCSSKDDNCPGKDGTSSAKSDGFLGATSVSSIKNSNVEGRDCSGNPVIRYSGDPVERDSSSRDPVACTTFGGGPKVPPVSPPISACHGSPSGGAAARRPTGRDLLTVFASIRCEIFPTTLPWNTARDSRGDAASFAASLSDAEILDLRETMRSALENIRDGVKGWNDPRMEDPSFAFGAWKSGFHLLREKLHKRAPPKPGSLEARPPSKPVVEAWKPKTDFAAEAMKDEQAAAAPDLSKLTNDLVSHVTPPDSETAQRA